MDFADRLFDFAIPLSCWHSGRRSNHRESQQCPCWSLHDPVDSQVAVEANISRSNRKDQGCLHEVVDSVRISASSEWCFWDPLVTFLGLVSDLQNKVHLEEAGTTCFQIMKQLPSLKWSTIAPPKTIPRVTCNRVGYAAVAVDEVGKTTLFVLSLQEFTIQTQSQPLNLTGVLTPLPNSQKHQSIGDVWIEESYSYHFYLPFVCVFGKCTKQTYNHIIYILLVLEPGSSYHWSPWIYCKSQCTAVCFTIHGSCLHQQVI